MENVVVDSTSAPDKLMTISDKACFGAGCYWGTEKYIKNDFGSKRYPGSILKATVGFMGPEDAKKNPSYREVCSGQTGHVEVKCKNVNIVLLLNC